MSIVEPKKFEKDHMKTQIEIPIAKGKESTHAFQWMLFKPQLHAVEPFEINKASRDANSTRSK
jgi:hypothetical protein